MKIALVNTYPHGGAGIACRRLQQALQEAGAEVALLTRESAGKSWPFYAERLSFLPYEKDKSVRFAYSLANFGADISQHPDIQSADVIHLHWINQGFLSLQNIQQLAATGKPIFWTLHDMWAFTGGCHYNRGCDHFQTASCGQCPMLKNPGDKDLSNRIWRKKEKKFPANLHFITCSEWLAGVARSSALLKNYQIRSIPNPIDTHVFKPLPPEERLALRRSMGIEDDIRLLLFVAMNINDERKGFLYLKAAIQSLREAEDGVKYEVLVLGKAEKAVVDAIPFRVHAPGMLSDPREMAKYYSIADVFVAPSLEDNLPNTVMEALACGTPVAGFPTGGIPEMVDHLVNGILTTKPDEMELAYAIRNVVIDPQQLAVFRVNAREKVLQSYDNAVVAKRYMDCFSQLVPGP
jgi:glycosyltransferase involved in cell wall biosynthesis